MQVLFWQRSSTLVATSTVSWSAVLITCAYSAGAALPMLGIMYGGNKVINSTTALAPYAETIRKFFGALMIVAAIAILFHLDEHLHNVALKYFPEISVENNELVKKELAAMVPNQNPEFNLQEKNPKAPELVGIVQWINSQPLTLADLKGKVVLIDFWTYSCINCIRTLSYLKQWYDQYKDKGFVIVGVHTPEFEFEKKPQNVQDAVKRFGITYPVALDSNYKTWLNYNNHYWPAHYLIDQQGRVQETHFGEGGYIETENAIRTLLGIPALPLIAGREVSMPMTPETYLGYERGRSYQDTITLERNKVASYDYKGALGLDQVGLKGAWLVGAESITAQADGSSLDLNFVANRVYLVMQSSTQQKVTVLLDNKPVPANYSTSDMHDGTVLVHDHVCMIFLILKIVMGVIHSP